MRLLRLAGASALFTASTALAASAADYYVRSLPGQPEGPLIKMHAGHIEVDSENNGNLFFWQFQNKHIGDRQRTVIWLNGGPGCSSMDGALMEVGPYRLKDDHTLVENPGSWHEFANLVFVDQPVGTGFSYVNSNHYVHELPEMAAEFLIFLKKYFELFPEYETDDLYFAGESYAGQHIPYIADAILKRNEEPSNKVKWNLKGLLIGNGWIDPEPQYMSYLTFAYDNGVVAKESATGNAIEKQVSVCQKALASDDKPHVDVGDCERILADILDMTTHKNSKGERICYNMYDVRKEDTHPSCGMNWPPDLTNVTPYLRRKDVTTALHINPDKKTGWTECAGSVSSSFNAKNSAPSVTLLPHILETVPVVLFSGDKDLICNHIGTEELIHNMEWNGGKGFETSPGQWAPREDWTFEDEPAGYYQTARNLTYVLFYNASHMVPFDYPNRSRDMVDRFMGVDIASIGGKPTDSRIGGEKGPITSVGGHPNSTAAQEAEKERLDNARWEAYRHSGEVALVLVATAAAIWGVFIWRQRQQRARGYKGLRNESEIGLAEQGREYDENQLDDLTVRPDGTRRYEIDEDSDSEDDDGKEKLSKPANGTS